jgi:thiol:disulfide interchange protein
MSASQGESQPPKPDRRFRWRVVPAIVLCGVGLLLVAASLFLAYKFGLPGKGMLSFERLPFLVMLLAGLIWVQAAFAVMRTQWLLAMSSALIGVAVFVLFAAFQNVTFQVVDDWGTAVVQARKSAEESASNPFGPSAESILEVALSAAKQQDKRVLVEIGGPPCSACRVLDEFFDRNRELFQDDYIIINLDSVRMRRSDVIENRLRHGRDTGIPWIVILDAEGREMISSDGPKGNIGYPATAEEIDYFVSMITKTTKRTSDEKIAAITEALREYSAHHGNK